MPPSSIRGRGGEGKAKFGFYSDDGAVFGWDQVAALTNAQAVRWHRQLSAEGAQASMCTLGLLAGQATAWRAAPAPRCSSRARDGPAISARARR
jgi:hypothetical protein